MRTGENCFVCDKPIMTNQIIIGFPVIRITDIKQSKMTGSELIAHTDCFVSRMQEEPQQVLTLNGKH